MFFRIPTETFKESTETAVYMGTGFCVSHTVGNWQMIWLVRCRSRHFCVDREICILYRILLGLELMLVSTRIFGEATRSE